MSELSTDRSGGQPLAASALTQDGWADRFVSEWEKDRRLTARRFLEFHPELASDRNLVAMLAFEEFRLRTAAGEAPDSQTFLSHYPDCHENLQALLAVYRFMGGESGLAEALRASPAREGSEAAQSEVDGPWEVAGDWPEPGQTVGGFKLLEMLGRGAYARVYLAEEPAVGSRRVVVKASLGGGNEAHTLGKLVHPNIVPIYSVQTEPEYGLTLICMPFLGRATLHDVLVALYRCGRPCPGRGRDLLDALASKTGEGSSTAEPDPFLARANYVDAVVHLGAQLADALAYTNSKSILHRDLKPSNILLDASGKPMLLDFNLSYDVERRSRRVAGTLGYAAPEILAALVPGRAGGVSADARSDLYSLGVILYELLSGQLPYGPPPGPGALAGNPAERWLSEQQGRPRPLARQTPEVGPDLASLIEGCLASDIAERPAAASEVAASLKRLLTRRSPLTRWARTHRRTLWAAVAVVSPFVAAGGYALATLPPYADRQFAAAEQARQSGEYESALTHLLQAEEHGFDRQQVFSVRGEVHYRLAKQAFAEDGFAAARDHATKAIEARLTTWQAYLLRARARFHLREFDLALDDLVAAESRRVMPQILSARGDCMCGKNKWELAVLAYKKAIEEKFNSAGLLNNLALALTRSGHREQSLEYLDRAIASDKSLADAYYQRAAVLAALAVDSRHDVPLTAIRDIETAIQLWPRNYRVHFKAAEVYAWHEKAGGVQDRERAINAALNSLRLGLDPVEFPRQGPLAELMKVVRGSAEYAQALADSSRVSRSDQPGLVDSLAGLDFDEADEVTATH